MWMIRNIAMAVIAARVSPPRRAVLTTDLCALPTTDEFVPAALIPPTC